MYVQTVDSVTAPVLTQTHEAVGNLQHYNSSLCALSLHSPKYKICL